MGNYSSDDDRPRSKKSKTRRKKSRSPSRSSSSDVLSSSGSSITDRHKKSSSSSRHRSSSSRSKKSFKPKRRRSPSRSHSHSRHSSRRRSRSQSRDRSSWFQYGKPSKRGKHKKHKRSHSSSSSGSSPSSIRDKRCYSSKKSYNKSSRAGSREKINKRSASKEKERLYKEERGSVDSSSTAAAFRNSSSRQQQLDPVKEEKDNSDAMQMSKTSIVLELSESDKLRRDRAIADIQDSSFTQSTFKSSRTEKSSRGADAIDLAGDNNEAEDEFNFGTSAELKSREAVKMTVEERSLFSPYDTGDVKAMKAYERIKALFLHMLFGDPEEREEKYLKRILSLRQRVYDSLTTAVPV